MSVSFPSRLALGFSFPSSNSLVPYLKVSTPCSVIFPLFIGFLSGSVMITFDDFSCRWGPLGLFLQKGPYFGNRCINFGTGNRRWMLLGGDLPQGIIEIPRNGNRATSDFGNEIVHSYFSRVSRTGIDELLSDLQPMGFPTMGQ